MNNTKTRPAKAPLKERVGEDSIQKAVSFLQLTA